MEKRGIRVESYIDKDTYDVCTRVVGLSERLIVTADNFNHLLQDAFQERGYLATKLDEPDLKKQSHMIVTLTLVKRHAKGLLTQSQLNFVELACSEPSQDHYYE